MLRPAQRVQDRHGLVRGRRLSNHLAHFQELVFRRTCNVTHHIWRVACEMFFHQLEYAVGILQGWIHLGKTAFHLVCPATLRVRTLGFVIACKQTVFKPIIWVNQKGRVCIVLDVLPMNFVIRQQIIDHTAQKGDIRTHANRRVVIGHSRRTRKARVNHDELSAPFGLSLNHPFKTARVCFSSVTAHNQY